MMKSLLVLVVTASLSGSAAAATSSTAESDTISRLFGNTVVSITPDGTRIHYFVEPDGTIRMRKSNGEEDLGKWRIPKGSGEACMTWLKPRSGEERCWRFTIEGNRLIQKGKTGQAINAGTIVAGRLNTF
jgi:hypothetical protein